jgi:hypothetical protein
LKINPNASLIDFIRSLEDACAVIGSQDRIIPSQARIRGAYETVMSSGPIVVRILEALTSADLVEGTHESGELVRFDDAKMQGSMLHVNLSSKPQPLQERCEA